MPETKEQLRSTLLELVNKHAVIHGDFVLTSGKKSTYYIDGKLLSLMPDGLSSLAKMILELIKNDDGGRLLAVECRN